METTLWAVIGLLVLAIIFLIYRFAQLEGYLRNKSQDQSFIQQLSQLSERLDKGLAESRATLQEQVRSTAAIVRDVTERLAKLDATNQQVASVGEQIKSLESILKNPKQRGVLGEYYLEQVLKNVLPPGTFELQYKFRDGEIVDAVVFIQDKIIPIDSKFSLENYNRILQASSPEERERLEKVFKNDLKNRIDETAKYIRPAENTMDFAFMFIPSEGIYYDLLINKIGTVTISTEDLIEYAFKKKHVIIVSPTSFLAYLQTVLQGLKALQIEKDAAEIRKRVEELGRHLLNFEEFMKRLGGQLSTVVNTYNISYKELGKIDKDVIRLTDGRVGGAIEPLALDKPKIEEG